MVLISFLDLAGKGERGGALLIVAGVGLEIFFLLLLFDVRVLGVNLDKILALRVLVLLSVYNMSYLASYTTEMKFQMASPMPLRSLRSFAMLLFTYLLRIYLAKKFRVTLMFLESDVKCSIDQWREMEWNNLLYSSGSVGAWRLYGIWMLMMSSSCWTCVEFASLLPPRGLVGTC